MTTKFKPGDKVYLVQRYPNSEDKPFVERTVIDVFSDEDGVVYVLDKIVLVSKDFYVGSDNRGFGAFDKQLDMYPAREGCLHKYGETVECWTYYHSGTLVTINEQTIDFKSI